MEVLRRELDAARLSRASHAHVDEHVGARLLDAPRLQSRLLPILHEQAETAHELPQSVVGLGVDDLRWLMKLGIGMQQLQTGGHLPAIERFINIPHYVGVWLRD